MKKRYYILFVLCYLIIVFLYAYSKISLYYTKDTLDKIYNGALSSFRANLEYSIKR